MPKSLFEDELIAGMEKELRKQASSETPSLAKAADCLHAALEIFEEQGMTARADQVLELLQKLAAGKRELSQAGEFPVGLDQLMHAGLTQRDIMEAVKGNPIAAAKFNLIARKLGMSERHIGLYIGLTNVMSPEAAKEILQKNTLPASIEWESQKPKPVKEEPGEFLTFKSIKSTAQKKTQRPDKISDRHTEGLTPDKEVENLKHHGTPFNMADDHMIDVPQPPEFEDEYQKWVGQFKKPSKLKPEDVDPDLAGLLEVSSFDIDQSDDELMGLEIADDTLEVFDAETPLHDFEDERD